MKIDFFFLKTAFSSVLKWNPCQSLAKVLDSTRSQVLKKKVLEAVAKELSSECHSTLDFVVFRLLESPLGVQAGQKV